jgi:hypothetical protein
MKKIKLITRINYKFSQYYHHCDLINKYNLKSFFKKPFIKSLILELSLNKLIDSSLSKFQYNNETLQIICFLIFYILSTFLPYINFNKSKSIISSIQNNYALKIIIHKEQDIYSFLHDIGNYLQLENFKEKIIQVNNKNNFLLNEVYKGDKFFELESFLNKYVKNINVKELSFFLRFNFISQINVNSYQNLIQNFPFLNK